MNTETRLTLRRANHLDAVNLYRLLVDEEKRTGAGRPFDENARMAHIIVTIAEGYVSVAVVSGRIVGSIAAIPRELGFSKEPMLVGEWFVLLPSFRDTVLGSKMMQRLCKFADSEKLGVQFTLPNPISAETRVTAEELNFVGKSQTFIREPELSIDDESTGREARPQTGGSAVDEGELPQ